MARCRVSDGYRSAQVAPVDKATGVPMEKFPSVEPYSTIARRLGRSGHPIVFDAHSRDYWGPPWLVEMHREVCPIDIELRDDAIRAMRRSDEAFAVVVAAWRLGGGAAVRQLIAPGQEQWW